MNNVAQTYTQLSVSGASPVGLVVALYDNALKSLHRARRAMDANDIELRTQYLNHVLSIIAHLQGNLDMERGGEVAATLLQFYSYARARVLEISVTNSTEKVNDLASHFSSLREAWQQVDLQVPEDLKSVQGRA
jgi:flagellar secretion chaperone FliS